jgi:hypothetical protein
MSVRQNLHTSEIRSKKIEANNNQIQSAFQRYTSTLKIKPAPQSICRI